MDKTDKLFFVTNEKNRDGTWNWSVEAPIRASNQEEAATLWAEQYDCGDYTIVGGSAETVAVKTDNVEGVAEFEVRGEQLALYHAAELV